MPIDHRDVELDGPHESTPLAEKVSRLRGTLPLVPPGPTTEKVSRLRGTLTPRTLAEGTASPDVTPSIARTIPGTRIRTTMPESKSIARTIPGTRIRTTMPEPK